MDDAAKNIPTDAPSSPTPEGLKSALGALLSNPSLMASISQIASGMGAPSQEAKNTAQEVPSAPYALDPAIAEKLPEMIQTLAPLLSQSAINTKPTPSKKESPADRRCALLLALRPFLSPERQSAADSLLRLSQLSDVLGSNGLTHRK